MTASSTGTEPRSTGTIREAAAAFEAALTPEGDTQEGAEGKTDELEETAQAAEEGESGAEDESEGAKPDEESEGEAEGDESEGSPSADQTFTVRVDGKEEQVLLSELLAGYSRTSDYTRKTQQVAELRKQYEAEAEVARRERAEYAALLPKLRASLEAGMGPEPDWEKLRQEDPNKAAIEWQRREERRRKVEAVRAEEQRLAQKAEADRAADVERIAIEQHNELLKKLPAWRDPKVAGAESQLVRKTLAEAGYGEDEMEIYDHRAILIARKAALYDQMVARQAAVKPKVVKAPVVKPGGGAKPSGNQAVNEARAQLKKGGTVKDAARLFEALL